MKSSLTTKGLVYQRSHPFADITVFTKCYTRLLSKPEHSYSRGDSKPTSSEMKMQSYKDSLILLTCDLDPAKKNSPSYVKTKLDEIMLFTGCIYEIKNLSVEKNGHEYRSLYLRFSGFALNKESL